MSDLAAENRRLLAENIRLAEQVRQLSDRLEDLQRLNEAAYRDAYDTSGGPRFDKRQPFGTRAPVTPATARARLLTDLVRDAHRPYPHRTT